MWKAPKHFRRLPKIQRPTPGIRSFDGIPVSLVPPIATTSKDDPEFSWLEQLNSSLVKHYISAENKYADSTLLNTRDAAVFNTELQHYRIPDEGINVPEIFGDFEYYGEQSPEWDTILYKRRHLRTGQTETVLDIADLPFDYAMVASMRVSHDQRYLALTVDTTGGEVYTGLVRDLTTGKFLDERLPGAIRVAFGHATPSGRIPLYYVRTDDALRPAEVWLHYLGQPVNEDVLLYAENDGEFLVDIQNTKDAKLLSLNVNSRDTSEVYLLDAAGEIPQLTLVEPRETGVQYFVEHNQGNVFIVTNADEYSNYKIIKAPVHSPQRSAWEDFYIPEPGIKIEDIDMFKDYMFLYERYDGNPLLHRLPIAAKPRPPSAKGFEGLNPPKSLADIKAWCSGVVRKLEEDLEKGAAIGSLSHQSPEASTLPAFANSDEYVALPFGCVEIVPGVNQDFNATTVRFNATFINRPEAEYDVDMETLGTTLLQTKTLQVPPWTYPLRGDELFCRREWATSHDGRKILISLVHSADVDLDGSNPMLMEVYGAYGFNLSASFDADWMPLLRRGWVLAFAHVRGGGELGTWWHHEGRKNHKGNTFADFVSCIDHVVRCGYTSPRILAVRGTSAGGMPVGYVALNFPSLIRAAIMEYPFVDVARAMRDPSLPMTLPEYREWGNPEDPRVLQHLMELCPSQSLPPGKALADLLTPPKGNASTSFPSLYIIGGMKDARVPVWQPLKFAARVRQALFQSELQSSSAENIESSSMTPHAERSIVEFRVGSSSRVRISSEAAKLAYPPSRAELPSYLRMIAGLSSADASFHAHDTLEEPSTWENLTSKLQQWFTLSSASQRKTYPQATVAIEDSEGRGWIVDHGREESLYKAMLHSMRRQQVKMQEAGEHPHPLLAMQPGEGVIDGNSSSIVVRVRDRGHFGEADGPLSSWAVAEEYAFLHKALSLGSHYE